MCSVSFSAWSTVYCCSLMRIKYKKIANFKNIHSRLTNIDSFSPKHIGISSVKLIWIKTSFFTKYGWRPSSHAGAVCVQFRWWLLWKLKILFIAPLMWITILVLVLMQQSENHSWGGSGFVEQEKTVQVSSLLSNSNLHVQIRLRCRLNHRVRPLRHTDYSPPIVESIFLSLKHGPCFNWVNTLWCR